MVSLTSLSAVALLIASGVIAAPWHSNSLHHTHRARGVGPTGVNLDSYHPPSVFEAYGTKGSDFSASGTPEEVAKSFLQNKLGVAADALTRHAGHSNDGVSYEYFTQTINGIPVSNAVANVAIKDGKVVSYGASFVKPKDVAAKEPTLGQERSIALAEEVTGGKWNQSPIELKYTIDKDGSCHLTRAIQVKGAQDGSWKEIYVDAHDGKTRNVIDFVADASYHVVPLQYQDPKEGYMVVEDPADMDASPKGWHAGWLPFPELNPHDTSGNNVISYKDSPASTTRESSEGDNYIYPYDDQKEPGEDPNVDAARVNTFYVVNAMHDLTYKYGFTEQAYNFQIDNFEKGGQGKDPVLVSVQDASGKNNANFATPPDGYAGQMRMFLWDRTKPGRDGALENDIVVHEYTHGVSNRMTGGGTGRCLQGTEAGGMGEGWSDAMADITEAKTSPLPDFTLGSYVTGNPKGIRTHPYSTDMQVNPLTYGILKERNEVHAVGEVWALMLHEILAALINKFGIALFDRNSGPGVMTGNSIMLSLMLQGFQTQPCNPTFISARDAIIQADYNQYGGENYCLLWRAFAKRGLGKGAQERVYTDSYEVPSGC